MSNVQCRTVESSKFDIGRSAVRHSSFTASSSARGRLHCATPAPRRPNSVRDRQLHSVCPARWERMRYDAAGGAAPIIEAPAPVDHSAIVRGVEAVERAHAATLGLAAAPRIARHGWIVHRHRARGVGVRRELVLIERAHPVRIPRTGRQPLVGVASHVGAQGRDVFEVRAARASASLNLL